MMELSHLAQLTPPLLTVFPKAIRFNYDLVVSTCLNPSQRRSQNHAEQSSHKKTSPQTMAHITAPTATMCNQIFLLWSQALTTWPWDSWLQLVPLSWDLWSRPWPIWNRSDGELNSKTVRIYHPNKNDSEIMGLTQQRHWSSSNFAKNCVSNYNVPHWLKILQTSVSFISTRFQ